MSFIKNNGMMVEEYVYDFAEDGGSVGFKDLSAKANKVPIPVGALIYSATIKPLTNFASAGLATLSVGTVATPEAFNSLAAFDSAAYLVGAGVALGPADSAVDVANDGKIGLNIAVAAVTAGKLLVTVQFMNPAAS